jgi:hypothetical protein
MTADTRTTNGPARLAAHEFVLLRGQPGSPADWQPVTARLPTQLHAIAADRPGYGSSRLPAGGFAANARAVLAAPGTGQLCALVAWRLTPWIVRARLARTLGGAGRPGRVHHRRGM